MEYVLIWLLPGAVLSLHQGIAHLNGEHVPEISAYGYSMPHWAIYALIMLLGPIFLLAMLADIIVTSNGRKGQ